MEPEEETYEDVYDEEAMDELEEDDEITPQEEAFMKGYTSLDKKKKKSKLSKKKHSSNKRTRR